MHALPILARGTSLASRRSLEAALAQTTSVLASRELNDQAAIHDLVKRMRLALVEQNRIAEFRLGAARQLGRLLDQQAHRGSSDGQQGPATHGRLVTSTSGSSAPPLPSGISAEQSAYLQEIARVPEDVVQAYLSDARRQGYLITMAGLLRAMNRPRSENLVPDNDRPASLE